MEGSNEMTELLPLKEYSFTLRAAVSRSIWFLPTSCPKVLADNKLSDNYRTASMSTRAVLDGQFRIDMHFIGDKCIQLRVGKKSLRN